MSQHLSTVVQGTPWPRVLLAGLLAAGGVLFAAATARAQAPLEPAPGPESSPTPVQPTEVPPPQPAPQPAATPQDGSPPPGTMTELPAISEPVTTTTGFHVSIGVGPSGGGAPGVASQFKIGVRLSPKYRLFYHALNHWYPQTTKERTSAAIVATTQWRIAAINGVGLDYFFVPMVGARISAGVGCECNAELFKGGNSVGYSFLLGLTFDLDDTDTHLSLDPFIHKLQFKPEGADSWGSTTVIGITLNLDYR